MSTRPRIYLCGAVDRLPDLGVGWRREAAAALEAAGLEAVWPTDSLWRCGRGYIPADEVRALWARVNENRRESGGMCGRALERLFHCDAMLVRWCSAIGDGTRAETAVARWAGIPGACWLAGGFYAHEAACGANISPELADVVGWLRTLTAAPRAGV